MRIEIFHASKFGNGAKVAEELRRLAVAKGHQADVHHVDDSRLKEMPPADLYVFGSPTRMGKPIRSMRKFAIKAVLPPGTKYAVFATHGAAVPNKKTGVVPTDEEMSKLRQTIPYLDDIMKEKGFVKVADKIFLVSGEELKGHLLEGWQAKAEEFANAILGSS